MAEQLRDQCYIQTKKIGFTKEQVVVVRTDKTTASDIAAFKQEVLRNAAIKMGTVSGFLPVASNRWNDMWYPAGVSDQKQSVNMQEWKVDPDYIPTLELNLVQGRNFTPGRVADSTAVVMFFDRWKQPGNE